MLNLRGKEERESYYYDNRDYKSGYMITSGTGVRWARENFETYVSFAYRYARTSYIVEEWYIGTSTTYKTNWNRLEIKVGISF